ncbi:RimJ/RimL family protein N-acetyltransferase [Diaminobutyricimonas aerilata]|uniref:RimJ/RimL family protein N-acetyltransferase n=1 Tax=Diaminobutyricimonas aerilata TaxID=1162967 RepID=A0A2M9CF76_9MICO|nr:GNAT family N-acetyltransferase [Diaminobutyricimonas aerilata]PJJ70505.1 RimJ/RimL family protein N-acetyltransferase [Diaminobutyricimonas aerilata]
MTHVTLRRWSDEDEPLLSRANTPEMTAHLGGPETDEQIADRHARYLRGWETGESRMFRIDADGEPVGGTGLWSTYWSGEQVHETGWFVVPEAQRRGIAVAALALVVADAREHGTHPLLTAFPAVANAASNAVCRKAGFSPGAEFDQEFRGAQLRLRAWTLRLDD